jgi:uncharacterized protein with von Willebrand factor type A (vWA) domain
MIEGLRRFVAALRREGIAASPAEVLDAARAVQLAGIEDRGRFREALRATLVKRSAQRAVFDRAFERFFAPPARAAWRKGQRPGAGRGEPGARRTGRSETIATRGPLLEPRRERRGERRRGDQDRLRRELAAVREGGPRRGERLRHAVLADRSGRGREPEPGRSAADPLRRDLRGRMRSEDERELAEAVPRLIERIRLRTGRRRRRAASGRFYLRTVFRENVSHDGVPFVLPRRRLRPRRPRVVLLVDMSWSCSRASALFLWMAGAFLRLGRTTRVLLFVDRPVDGTAEVERWMRSGDRGDPSALLAALPGLNPLAPSDYGRVFHRLLCSPARPGGRDTVLVILGDGRTNRLEPLEWALDEIAGRCASVLWLVPEPLALWGSGDSALPLYLPRVDVAVEVRDLAGLAEGVAELLRRL